MSKYFKIFLKITLLACFMVNLQAMETLPKEERNALIEKFIRHAPDVEEIEGCFIEEGKVIECGPILNAYLAPLNAHFGCFRNKDFCWLAQVDSSQGFDLSGSKALAFARLLALQKTALANLSREELYRVIRREENYKKLWLGLANIKSEKEILRRKKNSFDALEIRSQRFCCIKFDHIGQTECFASCDNEDADHYDFIGSIAWDMIKLRLAALKKEEFGLQ